MLTIMRPKLKTDTSYLPTANGVMFRNRTHSLELKGQNTFRWIESLAPYLDGQCTLGEITQGLDSDKQAWVAELLKILQTNHFLKDVSLDQAHTLSQAEEEAYACAIAYIDSFQESAAYRFERFREQRVLIIGSGLTCTTLVHAVLISGVQQLAVLTTEECETQTSRYQEYLDLLRERDVRQTLREIAVPAWPDEAAVGALLEPFDAVLHVSDRPMLGRALLLNRLRVAQKKPLIQAILIDNHAWIGPLVQKATQGCWECAWLRFLSHPSNSSHRKRLSSFQDHADAPINHVIALPTAALIANMLSFELFKYLTEAGPQEISGSMIDIDLVRLRIQKHAFLRHPLCSTCSSPIVSNEAAFLARIEHLEQREQLDQVSFLRQATPCFEEGLGLFSSLDASGYAQTPLSFCRATTSSPVGFEAPRSPLLVKGVGRNFFRARRRLMQRAYEVYAANMVDQRRLITTEKACQMEGWARKVPPALFLGGEDLAGVEEWIWALQLHTGEPRLVPAPLVFPVLKNRAPQRETATGVASGMMWSEAICQALLNWCQQVTILHIERRKAPYPQIDLSTASLSTESTIQRSIHTLRESVHVYDVTGPLQVPTFAFCESEKTITYSSHVDPVLALRTGLGQCVRYYQANRDQDGDDVLVSVPPLPVALRGKKAEFSSSAGPQGWPARQQWLQERLYVNSWQALATPLDHDPAFAQIMPFVVHVLLARVQDGKEEL